MSVFKCSGEKMNPWAKEHIASLFIVFDISHEFSLISGVSMGKECVS